MSRNRPAVIQADCKDQGRLRPVIDRLASDPPASLVVDLGGLRLIDSQGVGAIVGHYKRARAAGQVSVEVVIDVNGRVISAKATSGPAVLREAAERAAMQARFTPALLTGQPVKMSGTINYNFKL